MDKQLSPYVVIIIVSLMTAVLIVAVDAFVNALASETMLSSPLPSPECELLLQYNEWTVIRCREK